MRLVVARRWTGLGDCLVSLLAAWRYARATRRALVADWRFSAYAEAPRMNAFRLFFEPPEEWLGVPFTGDDRVNDVSSARPTHPAFWEGRLHEPPVQGERSFGEDAVQLIRAGHDVDAPTVVFDQCLASALPPPELCRRLLQELRPRPAMVAAVEAFAAERFAGTTIGVHVRQGNGGPLGAHGPYWEDPRAALARVSAAIREALAAAGDPATVFLCTDNPMVETVLRRRFPDLVTRPKLYREAGAGDLHRWEGAAATREDALVEMLLLARCDVLVRYPPGSFFSFWAATVLGPERCREA